MLDLGPIKRRLAESTPGPWKWREEIFRQKYMIRMKNGRWRARPGKDAGRSWVMLLTGPLTHSGIGYPEETLENIIAGYPDEWDYPHIIAIRWNQIRPKSLVNACPSKADADLIANAPTDLADLVEEVEKLRKLLFG